MKTKIFKILSLLLCVPSLMAVTRKNIQSETSYSDFSVTAKYLEPDVYELTINNYGDLYMTKDKFFKDNKYSFAYIPEHKFEKHSLSIIKPKETVTIKVRASDEKNKTNLVDGEVAGFSQMALSTQNDIVSVTGPYTISYNKHENNGIKYNTLDINCTTTEIKHLTPETPGCNYIYSYVVSWTYENTEYCNISLTSQYMDGCVSLAFDNDVQIDPSKITIRKIDSLINTGYFLNMVEPEPCGGLSIKYTLTETILMIVAVSFIGLGLLIGIFAFFFCTIRAIKRKNGKKIA